MASSNANVFFLGKFSPNGVFPFKMEENKCLLHNVRLGGFN
jgi:hypothetical protein